MNKNIVISVLAVIVLCLGGYLVYDKVIDKDEKTESNTQESVNVEPTENQSQTQEVIEQKDKVYFNDYLKVFLPAESANNFKKNVNTFTNEDITHYLFFYYRNLAISADASLDKYNVQKKDLDEIVYKYFGITEYELSEGGRDGIRKLDENIYQVYWFATGWMAPDAQITNVTYNGNEVKVEYKLTNEDESTENLNFYLAYNNGNYNVKRIEYIK